MVKMRYNLQKCCIVLTSNYVGQIFSKTLVNFEEISVNLKNK